MIFTTVYYNFADFKSRVEFYLLPEWYEQTGGLSQNPISLTGRLFQLLPSWADPKR